MKLAIIGKRSYIHIFFFQFNLIAIYLDLTATFKGHFLKILVTSETLVERDIQIPSQFFPHSENSNYVHTFFYERYSCIQRQAEIGKRPSKSKATP